MVRRHKAFRLGSVFTVTAMVGLGFGLPTAPAQARPSDTVVLPGHEGATALTLLAASPRGVVVRQSGIAGIDTFAGSANHFLSGAEGTQLSRRPAIEPTITDNGGSVLSVVGGTLTWSKRVLPFGGPNLYVVHRTDVRTGTDVVDGRMPPPIGFTGAAWLATQPASFTTFPLPPPALRQYPTSPAPGDPSTLLPATVVLSPLDNVQATATESGAVLLSSFTGPDPGRVYRLDLIDVAHGTVENLVTGSTDLIGSVALSPETLAWTTQTGGGLRISQRPRAGGAVTSYLESDPQASGGTLRAGTQQVGYLVTPAAPADPAGPVLRVVPAGAAPVVRSVALPPGSDGLAAVGNRFLTATGTTLATAGVYSVGPSGPPVRTATVPARTYPIRSLALTGGRIYYTDDSDPTPALPSRPVWWRPVSDGRRPTLGPESRFSLRSAAPSNPVPLPSIAFSAGRGAIATPLDNSVELLDSGAVDGAIQESGAPNVSGPYTLLNGKVYRPDGERIFTEPADAEAFDRADDIYGHSVIWSRVRSSSDSGPQAEVWADDVEQAQPVKLADPASCPGAPPVSIWGTTVAWGNCGDPTITVQALGSPDRRLVPTDPDSPVFRLVLAEGTLFWADGQGEHLLDLTRADSSPVNLTGSADQVLIDNHVIARLVRGPQGPDAVELTPLPFTAAFRPRLIGVLGPLGFTPDGDGHADTWTPEFDVTKPLRSVELEITQLTGTKALRTLKADAPDGSIRGLAWDGRDAKGRPLPVGTYRWILTGRADDGDGRLIAADGGPTVTGTIEIDAVPGG